MFKKCFSLVSVLFLLFTVTIIAELGEQKKRLVEGEDWRTETDLLKRFIVQLGKSGFE